ncbi:gamma-glutamyl-gamma-aminobutyrate hydrolase family protein [Algihabitans albus]|uniref:gamma-glutamyl-gamma-aminobutyrate hydrolase family protein n=1 Tax=Algihabitans albus TaxID=2164067 RepID=UPI000E5C7B5B|nr:gamma-glutamyl-gamma-aminobutyrate hydrolase family protein [Algihabitans albus]
MSTALVGVTADFKEVDGKPFHVVGDKYLRAVSDCTEATPFVVPALGHHLDIPELVRHMDGLVLTGSPANVHPSHYGADPHARYEPYDEARDATTLPLIREALAQKLPLFAICRGFQELNVVLGGTLHPRLHELEGRLDHRRPQHDDPDVQYGPNHPISLTPGGALAEILGRGETTVNSLHNQGIERLAPGLAVEATAPDGIVEAVRIEGAESFALGVQWHPEYRAPENPDSMKLYSAFNAAIQARKRRKLAA